MMSPLIDFSYSTQDWLDAFQQLFDILARFFKRAFDIDLFKQNDAADASADDNG